MLGTKAKVENADIETKEEFLRLASIIRATHLESGRATDQRCPTTKMGRDAALPSGQKLHKLSYVINKWPKDLRDSASDLSRSLLSIHEINQLAYALNPKQWFPDDLEQQPAAKDGVLDTSPMLDALWSSEKGSIPLFVVEDPIEGCQNLVWPSCILRDVLSAFFPRLSPQNSSSKALQNLEALIPPHSTFILQPDEVPTQDPQLVSKVEKKAVRSFKEYVDVGKSLKKHNQMLTNTMHASKNIGEYELVRKAWKDETCAFIAIDVETYEGGSTNDCIELGWSIIVRDAQSRLHEQSAARSSTSVPEATVLGLKWQQRTEHRILYEFLGMTNGKYVPDNRGSFLFGRRDRFGDGLDRSEEQSQSLWQLDAVWRNGTKVVDMHTTALELQSEIDKLRQLGPVYTVFHDYKTDLGTLDFLGIDIDDWSTDLTAFKTASKPGQNGVCVLDTKGLFSALQGENWKNGMALGKMSCILASDGEVLAWNAIRKLHNAANDAHYTLFSLAAMASGPPIEEYRRVIQPRLELIKANDDRMKLENQARFSSKIRTNSWRDRPGDQSRHNIIDAGVGSSLESGGALKNCQAGTGCTAPGDPSGSRMAQFETEWEKASHKVRFESLGRQVSLLIADAPSEIRLRILEAQVASLTAWHAEKAGAIAAVATHCCSRPAKSSRSDEHKTVQKDTSLSALGSTLTGLSNGIEPQTASHRSKSPSMLGHLATKDSGDDLETAQLSPFIFSKGAGNAQGAARDPNPKVSPVLSEHVSATERGLRRSESTSTSASERSTAADRMMMRIGHLYTADQAPALALPTPHALPAPPVAPASYASFPVVPATFADLPAAPVPPVPFTSLSRPATPTAPAALSRPTTERREDRPSKNSITHANGMSRNTLVAKFEPLLQVISELVDESPNRKAPLRGSVATELLRRKRGAFQSVGTKSWREYSALAESLGLVELGRGDMQGRDTISIHKKHAKSRLSASAPALREPRAVPPHLQAGLSTRESTSSSTSRNLTSTEPSTLRTETSAPRRRMDSERFDAWLHTQEPSPIVSTVDPLPGVLNVDATARTGAARSTPPALDNALEASKPTSSIPKIPQIRDISARSMELRSNPMSDDSDITVKNAEPPKGPRRKSDPPPRYKEGDTDRPTQGSRSTGGAPSTGSAARWPTNIPGKARPWVPPLELMENEPRSASSKEPLPQQTLKTNPLPRNDSQVLEDSTRNDNSLPEKGKSGDIPPTSNLFTFETENRAYEKLKKEQEEEARMLWDS